MKTWQALLRDHDPAAEARLEPADATAIRRAAVAASLQPRSTPVSWQRPLAMAAIVALMIGSGVIAGIRVAERKGIEPVSASGPDQPGQRRQLQFATPGGTRIIWELNPEFTLREAIP